MNQPRLEIRYLPIAALIEHEQNYNRHPPEQIAVLRAALHDHGQTRNIVVWDLDDSTYLIVAGNGLTRAARLEGWAELAARVLPPETPVEEVLAILVGDNETARRSEPDDVQLASLLSEIHNLNADLMEGAGFSEADYTELLESIGGASERVARRPLQDASPPRMAWVVIGIPLVRYGEVAEIVELLAEIDDAIVETTVNDISGEGDDDGDK